MKMNKELEQSLWEKAYDTVSYAAKTTTPTMEAVTSEFASLILKECVSLITCADDVTAINKHFGIEDAQK